MNTSVLRTLLPLSLLAIAGPVCVMAQDTARFTIPFDFAVGNQQLAAGEYVIGRLSFSSPTVLAIRRANGEGVLMTLANTGSPSQRPGMVSVRFDKIDNRYFLTQWFGQGHGLELPKPEAEKELVRRAARRVVTITASR